MYFASYIWSKWGPLPQRVSKPLARHPGRQWERVNGDPGHLVFLKDGLASLNIIPLHLKKLSSPVPMESTANGALTCDLYKK
jgi:hypothetical protein